MAAATRRPAATLALAAAGHFFNDAWSNVFPALVPLVATPLGLGLVGGALVITGARLASSVLQPFLGRMADRWPSRLAVPVALGVGGLATALLGWAGGLVPFLLLALIASAAGAGFHPPALITVRRLTEGRRGLATSLFLVGGSVGRSLGPLMMASAALWLGVHGIALLALPGLALALYLGRVGLGPSPSPSAAAQAAPPPVGPLLRQRWAAIALLLMVTVSRGVVTNAVVTLWPLLHGHAARALVGSTTVIAVMLLAGSVGNLTGGRLADRWPLRRLLVGALLGAVASLVGFALASGPWLFPLAALAGFFAMSTNPVTLVTGQDLMPESVAMASGVALGLGNAFTAAAVALLAVVASRWGGEAALLAAAALTLAGIPATLRLIRERRSLALGAQAPTVGRTGS